MRVSVVDSCKSGGMKPSLVSSQAPLTARPTSAPEVWRYGLQMPPYTLSRGPGLVSHMAIYVSDPCHAQGWLWAGLGDLGVGRWGIVNTRPGSSSLGGRS